MSGLRLPDRGTDESRRGNHPGKTNTPEFGAGSQTFNQVFGATCNPYNTDLTCGGSSGGAAVSLPAGCFHWRTAAISEDP